MIHQRYKDVLFFLAQPVLCVAGWGYRFAWRRLTRGRSLKLHVGCGEKYLPSFINVDINPFRKIDLWLDVRNPLPFPTGALEGIYAQETFEHLYPDECNRVLGECFRVLRPGGFIRIGVPHLRYAVEAYLQGSASWFSDWPRSYRSIGGRFSNFLLCDGQHRNAFDFPVLEELLKRAGFESVQECERGISHWIHAKVLFPLEVDSDKVNPARHLYVEAKHP